MITLPQLALLLVAGATTVPERPLWTGRLDPASPPVLLLAAPTGLQVRSATAQLALAGVAPTQLTPGLCGGPAPRLGVPAGSTLVLLAPGAPAQVVATVTLPSAAASAAVPVTGPDGCRLALLLASGDLALVGPAGDLALVPALVPAPADLREFPRGLLLSARGDLLVAGAALPQAAAVRLGDGTRFATALPLPAVPGAAWGQLDGGLWFLTRDGSLQAWLPGAGAAVQAHAGRSAAPGGLVAWGGRTDRGLAWTDLDGQLHGFREGRHLDLVRLPRGAAWPALATDLDDRGDLQLLVPLDGPELAVVSDDGTGCAFRLEPFGARPAGAPVAYQLDPDQPATLALPLAATRATLAPRAEVPAGPLARDGAVLVSGVQLTDRRPGAMTAALPRVADLQPPAPPARGGSGCTTAPGLDLLSLLLLALPLLRRRATSPAVR